MEHRAQKYGAHSTRSRQQATLSLVRCAWRHRAYAREGGVYTVRNVQKAFEEARGKENLEIIVDVR
jgi:hypothetical protein